MKSLFFAVLIALCGVGVVSSCWFWDLECIYINDIQPYVNAAVSFFNSVVNATLTLFTSITNTTLEVFFNTSLSQVVNDTISAFQNATMLIQNITAEIANATNQFVVNATKPFVQFFSASANATRQLIDTFSNEYNNLSAEAIAGVNQSLQIIANGTQYLANLTQQVIAAGRNFTVAEARNISLKVQQIENATNAAIAQLTPDAQAAFNTTLAALEKFAGQFEQVLNQTIYNVTSGN